MSSAAGVVPSPIRNESVLSPNIFHTQSSLPSDESILIYLAVSGSLIPMRVLESDSIESVKVRIQTCKGFVVKNQKLVCGGRELARSSSLVRDYGVTNGNVMQLVLRLSDLQVISVRTACGKEFTFHVERGRNVGYVKQQVARKQKEFIDLDEQEVVYNGEQVEDRRLIDDICKDNDAVIHLLIRKSAKVPTVLVKCLHGGFNHPEDLSVKIGSLQEFMENNGSCEDMGPGAFPVKEVHKICVLDIRLAHADMHAGNISLSKEGGQTVLIPIDHGYCLPESFEYCTFEWMFWPQARQPYTAEIVEYIKSLDAEEDISLLKFLGWDLPIECARAERGLAPFVIGGIMCRERLTKKSVRKLSKKHWILSFLAEVKLHSLKLYPRLWINVSMKLQDRCLDENAELLCMHIREKELSLFLSDYLFFCCNCLAVEQKKLRLSLSFN